MDQETHPGSAALAAYALHVHNKNAAREKRISAAAHRKEAKTHIYTGLLKTLETQVARTNPALAVIAEALQLLLTHREWDEKTLTRLSGARTKTWPSPGAGWPEKAPS